MYVGGNRAVFASLDNEGVLVCKTCPSAQRYKLNWPEDAYFQITYKGQKLWAYNRAFAVSLLAYLESETRKKTTVSDGAPEPLDPFSIPFRPFFKRQKLARLLFAL